MVIDSTIERIKARWVALAAVVLIVAAAGSYLLFRSTSIRGLPDIGEPFDVAQYATVSIPDDENAFTFFRRASDRFVGQESDLPGGSGHYADSAQVPPEAVRLLDQNHESLDLWFEATRRDRASYIQAKDATIETMLPVTQRLRTFTRLAKLRALRLRLDGDYAGAWSWIRANLRSGLLSGQNGFVIERFVGVAVYAVAAEDAIEWADDPRVDAGLLRKALDDTLAMESIAPVYSTVVRHEYYTVMNTLAEPRLLAAALTELTPVGRRTWLTPWKERLMSLEAVTPRAREEP